MAISWDCLPQEKLENFIEDMIGGMLEQQSKVPNSWVRSFNIFSELNWFYKKPEKGDRPIKNTNFPPFAFHPNSCGIQMWNAIYNFWTLAVLFLFPLYVGFDFEKEFFWKFSLGTTIVVFIDILMTLNTAVKDRDGEMITDKFILLKNYIQRGKIIFDLLVGIPWVAFAKFNNFVLLLHCLVVLKLLDSRDIHLVFSVQKISKKYGLNVILVAAIKTLFYQFCYW
jgi:hypothetical protein